VQGFDLLEHFIDDDTQFDELIKANEGEKRS
jgi:hypothetical protein